VPFTTKVALYIWFWSCIRSNTPTHINTVYIIKAYKINFNRPLRMHEIWTIAIDKRVVRASVSLSVKPAIYWFTRWHHFNTAILHYCSHLLYLLQMWSAFTKKSTKVTDLPWSAKLTMPNTVITILSPITQPHNSILVIHSLNEYITLENIHPICRIPCESWSLKQLQKQDKFTFSKKILQTRLEKETADKTWHFTAHKRLQYNTTTATKTEMLHKYTMHTVYKR